MMTSELPWTPDFDVYDLNHKILNASVVDAGIEITWEDGQRSVHNNFLLRENSPDEQTVHPLSREMLISPLDLPDDLHTLEASTDESGALIVKWSDDHNSRFHPGWLRDHAWIEKPKQADSRILWKAADMPDPPTFDGKAALEDDRVLLAWLEALNDVRVSRLEGLEDSDTTLFDTVERIGVIRESNFGRMYVLEIKDDPDSNAFTSDALTQHMDMPTRENPHGLQFLFCRRNTTTGGEGVYVDAFKVAEDLRIEEPDVYQALTTINWEFRNKSKVSDYRGNGPVFGLDEQGRSMKFVSRPGCDLFFQKLFAKNRL